MDSRRIGYMLIGGAALGALGALLFGRKKRSPLVSPGQRVVLIGDSLGVGLRKPLASLAEASRVELFPQACGGTMIRQWTKERTAYPPHDTASTRRCDFGLGYVRDARPDVVLISLGTNDAYAPVATIQDELGDVRALVQAIRQMGATPVWVDPPHLAKAPHEGQMRQLIATADVVHFPSYELGIEMGGDAIHPTGAGYARWADALWTWLTE